MIVTGKEIHVPERSVRRALLRKELKESRPAVIAGAAIFLGMPAIWTFLYVCLDTHHEVFPGTATILLLLAGWLFGAVVAAQTVCRDFGRPQGAFLLARPVSAADVLRAKVRAGLTVVGGVAVAVGLWELLLWGFAKSQIDEGGWPWELWIPAAATTVLTFWVALTAATITRQMLSAVMITGLVLVLLVAVPLMTALPAQVAVWMDLAQERLGRPGVYRSAMSFAVAVLVIALVAAIVLRLLRRASFLTLVPVLALLLVASLALAEGRIWPLTVIVIVLVVAALLHLVALRACQAQRAWPLGTKAVAWTIGLTMVLLGTLAFTQVGANTRVTATCWDPQTLTPDNRKPDRGAVLVSAGIDAAEHKLALGRRHIACASHASVQLYEITADGQIRRHPARVSGTAGALTNTRTLVLPVPAFDEQDRLLVVWSLQPSAGSLAEWQVDEVDPDTDRVTASFKLPEPPAPPVPCERAVVYDAALDANRLFVFYGGQGPADSPYIVSISRLAAYDLGGNRPSLTTSFDVWGDTVNWAWPHSRFQRGPDGRLYVALNTWSAPIDLSASELRPQAGMTTVEHAGDYGGRILPLGGQREATSTQTGFAVVEVRESPVVGTRYSTYAAHVIGEAKSSPWAWLFRADWATLVAGGPGRVWETHYTSAICYDVTDVAHPRRVAHVTTYRIRDALSSPDYLLLDHGPGFSLVRNPR